MPTRVLDQSDINRALSRISHEIVSAIVSSTAIRVGFRLWLSTRGFAPAHSCLARWAATVMKRNFESTLFGRIIWLMRSHASLAD